MMKKFSLFLILFLMVGCTKGEEVTCNIEGKKAIFTLKNGIVSSYKLDGKEVSKSEIDEINGTYFTSSTNNEEGKNVLNNYVFELGGTCEEN